MLLDEVNRSKVYVWTEEADERLLRLRKQGYSYPRIAEMMDIPSEGVVRRRVEKLTPIGEQRPLGPFRPFTDEEKEEFKKLFLDGVSMSDIAAKMGRTKGSVCGMRLRMGLPKRIRIAKPGEPNPYGCQISKTRLRQRCDGKPRAPKIAKDPSALREAEQRLAEAADVGFHGGGLTFAQLTPSCCRFIKGEVQDPAHRYCGSKVVPGHSWCRHHMGVVFRPEQSRVR
jgi:hypothetical protein